MFRSHIKEDQDPDTVRAFYDDIVKVLDYYRALKFGVSENVYSTTVRDVAFKMRYIQTDLYIPFAISVLHYCADGKISPRCCRQ
jgi:hypothetical protein